MDTMRSKELSIGRAGQYLVLVDLLLKGIEAFETGEGVGYDVVADLNGKLIKLQVKTTQKKRVLAQSAHPIYFFHIKRAGKNGARFYQVGDFDAFALVALDIRQVFYLPFDGDVKANSVCIRDKATEYYGQAKGGKKNGLYYQDLTWENLCEKL